MALPSSGQLSLNQIHIEAGGTTGTEVTLNDSDVRTLISKGAEVENKISEYYGASSTPSFTVDETSTVGTNSNLIAYLQTYPNTSGNNNLNLGVANNSSTLSLRIRMGDGGTPEYYTQTGSSYRIQSPAVVADASGHRHDHIGFVRDGGDGYGFVLCYWFWEADSGGALSGTSWGSMKYYDQLQDSQDGSMAGPTVTSGASSAYVNAIAHSGGVNVTNPDNDPYTYGDIAMLSQLTNGAITNDPTNIYTWTGGIIYMDCNFN